MTHFQAFKQIKISKNTQSILLLLLVCMILITARVLIIQSTSFIFLVWNLFLAWLPLYFALIARRLLLRSHSIETKFLALSQMILWLLFFPNSPYIITDLLHLRGHSGIAIWYDSLMIFIFAFTGLIMGIYSLKVIHDAMIHILGRTKSQILLPFILMLSGFGIYLGRYSRWNSWDIVMNPKGLLIDIYQQTHNPMAIKLSLVFGFVMWICYLAFLNLKPHESTQDLS